jgi:hypothetical protein
MHKTVDVHTPGTGRWTVGPTWDAAFLVMLLSGVVLAVAVIVMAIVV